MMERIYLDLFAQPKYILDGLDLHLSLNQSLHSFNLLGAQAAKYVVHLNNKLLLIRKVTINPDEKVAHFRALQITPSKFPTSCVDMKTYTILAHGNTWVQENTFLGANSHHITLAYIKSTAVNCAHHQNPFNFEHFGIKFLALFINGRQVPTTAFTPTFEHDNANYVRTYMQMYSGAGKSFRDEDIGVSYADFPGGYSVFLI